ncbi:MAG: FG-GAP repeat protein, partial [Deltaproteobacteria bacterium]|nr:FG-GAP repeat protein [Deltaproteobacteria bacterium]
TATELSKATSMKLRLEAVDKTKKILGVSSTKIFGVKPKSCNPQDFTIKKGTAPSPPLEEIKLATSGVSLQITAAWPPGPVLLCDLMGDRKKELIIAYPTAPRTGKGTDVSGQVYVLDGTELAKALKTRPYQISLDNKLLKILGRSGDQLGEAMLCTDLDGDGKDDLVLGAPGTAHGDGRVNVIFGGGKALSSTSHTLDFASNTASVDVMTIASQAGSGEALGTSLTTLAGWGKARALAIGAPNADERAGAAYVLVAEEKATWRKEAALTLSRYSLLKSPLDSFHPGSSDYVVASNDNLIAIGTPFEGEKKQGAVYVFRRSGKVWSSTKTNLNDSSTSPLTLNGYAYFGASVAVLGSDTVVVGIPGMRRVATYRFTSGHWELLGEISSSSSTTAFGSAVAVTNGSPATKQFLAVGDPERDIDPTKNYNEGMVFVYERPSSESRWGSSPTVFKGEAQEQLGSAIAITGVDPSYNASVEWFLYAGVPNAEVDNAAKAGAVRIFSSESSGEDSFIKAKTPEANAHFGRSIAIADQHILVAAPGSSVVLSGQPISGAGVVHVFDANQGGWLSPRELGHPLEAPRPLAQGEFGETLAATATWLVVGAPARKVKEGGTAYLLHKEIDGSWTRVSEFSPRETTDRTGFGVGVGVGLDSSNQPIIVVGGNGMAALFGANPMPMPMPMPILRISGAEPGSRLGTRLAAGPLDGDGKDDLVISAPGFSDKNKTVVGAAMIFPSSSPLRGKLDRGVRIVNRKDLTVLQGPQDIGKFASALAVLPMANTADPGHLLVSAPSAKTSSSAGSVYVFEELDLTPNKVWGLNELSPARFEGVAAKDNFGQELLVSQPTGNTDMLVAAPGCSGRRGCVYLLRGPDIYAKSKVFPVEKNPDLQLIVKGSKEGGQLGLSMARGELDGKGT